MAALINVRASRCLHPSRRFRSDRTCGPCVFLGFTCLRVAFNVLDSTSSMMSSGMKVKQKPCQYFGAKLTVIDSPAGQQKDNWRMRFVF